MKGIAKRGIISIAESLRESGRNTPVCMPDSWNATRRGPVREPGSGLLLRTGRASSSQQSCALGGAMYAALQAVDAEVTYLPVEGAEHSFILHLGTPEAQTALAAIEAFLAEAFSVQ